MDQSPYFTVVFWYRVVVLIVLCLVVTELSEIKGIADAARVNAARALAEAKSASSNAGQALGEAYDAKIAAENCRR